jgi:nicotinate-nucleotide adenylyltransferase
MWFAGPARRVPDAGRPLALRLGLHLETGMRVGLYGGSFNPVHDGHLQVARTAKARLGLDRVIWLVTPGNPLKEAPTGLAARVAAVRGQVTDPSMVVSALEARTGTRYSLDTLRVLKARYPGVHFVWIMGADNLAGFHRWRGWTQIMRQVPIAVVARPGAMMAALSSPAARRFAHARVPAAKAKHLPLTPPPAWVFLPTPLNFASSTALRSRGLVG